jgi:acetyl esterase/lipase
MTAGWALLAASVVFAWLAWNAMRPIRSFAALTVVSFFAGWLTAELWAHVALGMAALTGALVLRGALSHWSGQAGLVLSSAAMLTLLVTQIRALGLHRDVHAAALAGLGDDHDVHFEEETRQKVAEQMARMHLVMPFPVRHAKVETVRDVVFHQEGRVKLRLDVHRPRKRSGSSPVLVYVHGGGWIIGQRRYQGLPMMHHLAAQGWTCFSIDYRLSPRATFPDHLVDVKRAIAWVREHAEEYGGDASVLLLAGNSAGGHLASLAALTPNDAEYQPGFERANTHVDGCLSFYGVYDFTDRHGHWPHTGMRGLLEHVVMKASRAENPEAFEKASPMSRISADAPPFFIVQGDCDTLVPVAEARRFAEVFRQKASAPIVYLEIPGAQHAFEVFPSVRTAAILPAASRFAWFALTRARRAREVSRLSEERSGIALRNAKNVARCGQCVAARCDRATYAFGPGGVNEHGVVSASARRAAEDDAGHERAARLRRSLEGRAAGPE